MQSQKGPFELRVYGSKGERRVAWQTGSGDMLRASVGCASSIPISALSPSLQDRLLPWRMPRQMELGNPGLEGGAS